MFLLVRVKNNLFQIVFRNSTGIVLGDQEFYKKYNNILASGNCFYTELLLKFNLNELDYNLMHCFN